MQSELRRISAKHMQAAFCVFFSGGCRPSDNWGGGGHQGHLDPEMGGGGGGSQFGLKIRGEQAGPPGPSPGYATVLATVYGQ